MEKWFQYLIAFPNKSYIRGYFTQCLAKGYTSTIITKKSFGILNDWHVER